MKVIDGGFPPQDEKEKAPLKEVIADILEQTEIGDLKDGTFLFVFDNDDKTTFVTNEKNPAEVVYTLESIKQAVIGN